MYHAIDIAIEGEIHAKRLSPRYTNIALLYGSLWDFAAAHNHRADWLQQSAAWTEDVYTIFAAHNSFLEYNSPTYYGTDLLGLALWRDFGSTPRIRTLGALMESTLWNDVADFYSAPLRNISGPYDRAYGMDMESYVAVMGVWIAAAVPQDRAPLPPLTQHTEHVFDVYSAPLILALGVQIPPAALAKLLAFPGPHLVTRQIDDHRRATAWIGSQAIWGGEFTTHTLTPTPKNQSHPVTVQWRTPAGPIAWIQLTTSPPIDATADAKGITIDTAPGDITFHIFPAPAPDAITQKSWHLPGLHAEILTDAPTITTTPTEVTYKNATHLRLNLTPTP
jgi:hypothetical protein